MIQEIVHVKQHCKTAYTISFHVCSAMHKLSTFTYFSVELSLAAGQCVEHSVPDYG